MCENRIPFNLNIKHDFGNNSSSWQTDRDFKLENVLQVGIEGG